MSPLRSLLPALLLLSSIGLSPAAHAVEAGGSVAGNDGVLHQDCRQHPYSYALSIPEDAESWDLEVTVLGPDGLEDTSDYLSDGAYETSGVATFQMCGGGMPGLYTLTATLTHYDADYNRVTTELPAASFSMRLPYTRTALSVSDRTPRYNQAVTFKIKTVDERPNGYFATPYATVRLQSRRDGRWVNVTGSKTTTSSTGVATLRFRWNTRATVKVRAVTLRDDYYSASTSRTLKIG